MKDWKRVTTTKAVVSAMKHELATSPGKSAQAWRALKVRSSSFCLFYDCIVWCVLLATKPEHEAIPQRYTLSTTSKEDEITTADVVVDFLRGEYERRNRWWATLPSQRGCNGILWDQN